VENSHGICNREKEMFCGAAKQPEKDENLTGVLPQIVEGRQYALHHFRRRSGDDNDLQGA
jgi:hypothetical protein